MLFWAVLASCGGAGAHPAAGQGCPRGGAVVQTDDEAAALAGCRAVDGDLRIGPSFSLSSLAPLGRLERVSGAVRVDGNLGLAGVYLPGLRAVGGALVVEDNRLIDTAAFAHLQQVGGDLVVRDNAALERLDLGALRRVGGRLELSGQPLLAAVLIDRLERAGSLVIDGVPAWSPAEIEALRRRLHQ